MNGGLRTEEQFVKAQDSRAVVARIEFFYNLPNLGARALKTTMTAASPRLNIVSFVTFSSPPVPTLVLVTLS